MIYESILEAIGNTPSVKLNRIAPEGSQVFVKLESLNPMGSVKDRPAKAIIEKAEQSGELQPGQTVIEATSGNTGIALAMVCAAKGYPFVAVMVETFSIERRKIMRGLGAKVVLTPAADKASGMVEKAEQLAKANNWFLTRQFENKANPDCHYTTTGPEIINDFKGRELDYLVAGWGTGGTLTGIARAVTESRQDTRIVAVEPEASAMLSGNPWQPHKIQGIGPNFFPKVFETNVVNQIKLVSDEQAKSTALRLAREEGIFVGLSAGAAVAGALQIAELEPGKTLLVILPDTAERYLSTYLFEELEEGSDDLETEVPFLKVVNQ